MENVIFHGNVFATMDGMERNVIRRVTLQSQNHMKDQDIHTHQATDYMDYTLITMVLSLMWENGIQIPMQGSLS